MESEVRRRLVVAPLFRAISMQTNVMTMPLNPEAGLGTWVNNSEFGAAPDRTTASNNLGKSAGGSSSTSGMTPGVGSPHRLKEVTLAAYKVATNEYLAYEEEEDSILVVLPIIRDAMIRRLARTVDRGYLLGDGGASYSIAPFAGLDTYAGSNKTGVLYSAAASTYGPVAQLRAMRKNLGAWGLDPSEIVYVVSQDVYYDLMEDASFQDMSKVGPLATQLTGQIGQVAGSPVLVSAEFASKSTGAGTVAAPTGATGAICFAPGNFLAGNQRGLRMDTQELVETQRRVLVASLRTGLTQVTSNLGSGASRLVWAATAS
jgi:hypothetical protein